MRLKLLLTVAACVVLGPACEQTPRDTIEEPRTVILDATGESRTVIRVPRVPDTRSGYDIRELVKRVAADSDMRFVLDPRVNARVDYEGAPIESITYPILLLILRIHGYAAVEIGGVVSIVLDANARTMPTRILQSDDPSVSDHEVISRVISLSVDAAGLVPILRPLVPQYGHLAAFGNSLIVVDRYDNVRRITELAQSLSGRSSTASE